MKTAVIVFFGLMALVSAQNTFNVFRRRPVVPTYTRPVEGQYRPSNNGAYTPDNSGSYRNNDGKYYPDNSGQYVHQDYKYQHTNDKFGNDGGNNGGFGPDGGRYSGDGNRGNNQGGQGGSGGGSLRPVGSGGAGSGLRPGGVAGSGLRPSGGAGSGLRPGSGAGSGLRPGGGAGSGLRPSGAGSGFRPSGGAGSASTLGLPVGLQQGSAAGKYDNRNYGIIRKVEHVDEDGYHYLYETENGITGEEQGKLANRGTKEEAMRASGFYTYTGPDNIIYTVKYTADENGFVPDAAHIPTPPPIPAQILKALEYQRAAGTL